jgi:hypothetical protein
MTECIGESGSGSGREMKGCNVQGMYPGNYVSCLTNAEEGDARH